MTYIQAAFESVIENAKTPEHWYVCLIQKIPYYGGPEEGGWYGEDTDVVAYAQYHNEELAQAAADKVKSLAKEMEAESQKEYGNQCLHEMEWLEARGLEANYLPEPDGPDSFYVWVGNELPAPSRGCRHYE